MKLKHDVVGIMSALFITALLVVFPFINPCTSEDGTACTWRADTTANGIGDSFINYYGITLYLP